MKLTCCGQLLPLWQLQAADDFPQPGQVLGGVPGQMRHKIPHVRQTEFARRPREPAELLRCHFISDVSQDCVVKLDDRSWVLGWKMCGSSLQPVGVNSGTEFMT